jgi:hypothetical protein
VLSDDEAGAPVVDADKVVAVPAWVRHGGTVEQDDGDRRAHWLQFGQERLAGWG